MTGSGFTVLGMVLRVLKHYLPNPVPFVRLTMKRTSNMVSSAKMVVSFLSVIVRNNTSLSIRGYYCSVKQLPEALKTAPLPKASSFHKVKIALLRIIVYGIIQPFRREFLKGYSSYQ